MEGWADPTVWRWVWAVVAAGALVAEIATAGSFVALPFAIGAAVAFVLALLDAPLAAQAFALLLTSAAGVLALRPLARRLERSAPVSRTGANRWVGRQAVVIDDIPAGHGTGKVRLDTETWLAESIDVDIPAGSTVLVTRVDGVRLLVLPVAFPDPADPAELPQEGTQP